MKVTKRVEYLASLYAPTITKGQVDGKEIWYCTFDEFTNVFPEPAENPISAERNGRDALETEIAFLKSCRLEVPKPNKHSEYTKRIMRMHRHNFLLNLLTIAVCAIVCSTATVGVYGFLPYPSGEQEYSNVYYSWDDDRDRYEEFVEDLRFTIPTNKTIIIFEPNCSIENIAIVAEERASLTGYIRHYLSRFYINAAAYSRIGKGEQI